MYASVLTEFLIKKLRTTRARTCACACTTFGGNISVVIYKFINTNAWSGDLTLFSQFSPQEACAPHPYKEMLA